MSEFQPPDTEEDREAMAEAHWGKQLTASTRWEWHELEKDGPPPLDGESIFIGVNVNGYVAAFNAMEADGSCFSLSPESFECVMSGLKYWAPYVSPASTPA